MKEREREREHLSLKTISQEWEKHSCELAYQRCKPSYFCENRSCCNAVHALVAIHNILSGYRDSLLAKSSQPANSSNTALDCAWAWRRRIQSLAYPWNNAAVEYRAVAFLQVSYCPSHCDQGCLKNIQLVDLLHRHLCVGPCNPRVGYQGFIHHISLVWSKRLTVRNSLDMNCLGDDAGSSDDL